MQKAPQWNTPGHGHVGVDQDHVTVHFDSVRTVTFDVPIADFEMAVKSGKVQQIAGFTLRPDVWETPAKFWFISYTKKERLFRIQLHRSLDGCDLMVVKKGDLLRAIRDVC